MPAQDQGFDVRVGRPDWLKTIAKCLHIQRHGIITDCGRKPIPKMCIIVRIKSAEFPQLRSRKMMIRKMRMDEGVGMTLRTLMLMNVLKRRLQECKHQYKIHQHRNTSSHDRSVPATPTACHPLKRKMGRPLNPVAKRR